MSKEEFLKRLEEALEGEVPASVIRENLNYYNNYISQEMAKGRTVKEIVEEIGDARIIARTIIDSSAAAGETGDQNAYGGFEDGGGYEKEPEPKIRYVDLNKWYWKLLITAALFLLLFVVLGIVSGLLALLMRIALPILVIVVILRFITNLRR